MFDAQLDEITLQLYKNVFSPFADSSLAFIGFVQPASGGVLSMSEMQARWWAELCRGNVHLPSADAMLHDIAMEKVTEVHRNITYSRTVVSFTEKDEGSLLPVEPPHHPARPDRLLRRDCRDDRMQTHLPRQPHPRMEVSRFVMYVYMFETSLTRHACCRLLLGSCGTAQYRLQGPGKWSRAAAEVRKVPVTPMMIVAPFIGVYLLYHLLCFLFHLVAAVLF